jgi:hypothetical protein
MVAGLSPDVNIGSDDPVNRDAAVAAAATLRRVPRTSILLGERAGGGTSVSEATEISVSLEAGVKSPLPNVSLTTDGGSLSDSFSAAKPDEGCALLFSTVEVGPERTVVGFLAPVAVGVSPT